MSSVSRSSPTLATLPVFPATHIMGYLDIDSLWNLACTSRVFMEFVQDLKIRTGGYHVDIQQGLYKIHLPAIHYYYSYYEEDDEYLIDSMDKDYKDFQSLFPENIDVLRIDATLVNHFHRFNQECTVLSVGEHPIYYDKQKMNDCSTEQINLLLNSVNFRKGLALNGPKPLVTENEKIFNIDWLHIKNCTWITPEFIRKLRNKIVYLTGAKELTEEDINQYLKDLKNGKIDNKNLQVIGFNTGFGRPRWNKEAILDGLDTVRAADQIYKVEDFDKRIKSELFLGVVSDTGDIKIEDSFDFTRDDGIKISVEFICRTVRIYIWNQKQMQNLDKDQDMEKVTKKRGYPEDTNGPAAKKSCL
ncbi:hypothetical protein GCK72_000210 [Caenorhabditis remanei]|uniref:F-box domain-containing protein n=1 Tax=Caenorhabditis remanei TaxID=31234 RepID=A0A6A5HKI9_CAERE|nr:hypothetical protein GCK72_000210 [Caenorhabditis remanei]KAF1768398.1 hypothetical protein GCK72_000210 [Caenorhabditis remanei]